ncbi:MAG: hypothetical protein [Bacteriophage sp.]|nr:MAG: hypothetical protein [Bacteriophage sp.]
MTNYLKVTKKPVYEDAVQFRHDLPKSWNLCKTFVGAKWSQTRNAGFVNTAYVETPEGRTALVDGDFIVHGLNQGEFFVLSEVQFHESYDIIASMRKWEPKKGILDDKDPWEDITHIDELYPTDLLKMMLPTQRTVTFNDEEIGRMEGQYHDGIADSMAGAIDISKKLSTPMDHILSDIRSQAAILHGEKVRKNDKTKTDG